jgi:hypothetical protein
MTILKDSRPIKDLTLPESGIRLRVRDGLLMSDIEVIDNEKNDVRKTVLMLSRIVFEWDAENENGERTPITMDALNLLSFNDIRFIQTNLKFINDFLEKSPN